MPFALILIGLVMVITGARNTHAALGDQLVADFTGPNNFTYWILSIGAVGAVGYVKSLETLSRMFMLLIILAMIIKNQGLFDKLQEAIRLGPEASAAQAEPTISLGSNSTSTDETKSASKTSDYVKTAAQIIPFLL